MRSQFANLSSIVALFVLFVFSASPTFAAKRKASNPTFWPPLVNRYYPDFVLYNQDGRPTRLSSFRGKVIIVEPIGMSCPACQAFAGANKPGVKPYGFSRPQRGLQSIEEMLKQQGVSLGDSRLVLIQLLLYSPKMKVPTAREAQAWAKNFNLSTRKNTYVLAGNKAMINRYSYNMIPGFQLIDKNFVLRSDATGHRPKHNLYTHLLPMVKKLL